MLTGRGTYVGRFAPSPTGPLHFGSLVAALGSYLDARARAGHWLLRIEDVDLPRTVAGAEAEILRALERFGFEWDGPVLRQSERFDAYAEALERLRAGGLVFGCACTRREIADSSLAVEGTPRYPGTCRDGVAAGREARSVRMRAERGDLIAFDDAVQGRLSQDVGEEVGDFVLHRADGMYAYQLAVVVDDAAAGVTDVVRGADLLDSTCRQILLQRALGVATPRYLHLPVATDAAGAKLSKQTRARALEEGTEAAALLAALRFLGQHAPEPLACEPPAKILAWAVARWRVDAIPKVRSQPVGQPFLESS